MQTPRYTLSQGVKSPTGVEVFEGIDTQLDRQVTCVRFPAKSGDNSSELKAYKDLCRVNHPNSLEILDIVPEEKSFLIIAHRTKGLDVSSWLEINGPVSQKVSHRFALELLEWMLAWKSIHGFWPYLVPQRIWITEDEDGDLQMKVGRVVYPVPENFALKSARAAISIIMGHPEDFEGSSKGALIRFFQSAEEGGVQTIRDAHTSLEITRPLLPTSDMSGASSKNKEAKCGEKRFRIPKFLIPEGRRKERSPSQVLA